MADANSLLDALIALKPLPPSEEWQTAEELHAGALTRKERISLHAVKARINALLKAGKAETTMAPRRKDGQGRARYYRVKK